jgi:hypothetical protein
MRLVQRRSEDDDIMNDMACQQGNQSVPRMTGVTCRLVDDNMSLQMSRVVDLVGDVMRRSEPLDPDTSSSEHGRLERSCLTKIADNDGIEANNDCRLVEGRGETSTVDLVGHIHVL